MFRALLREQEDLAWAPDPFAVLEMAVVRCATLAPGDRVEELLARIDSLEKRLAGTAGGDRGPDGSGGSGKPGPARRPASGASDGKRKAAPEAAPVPSAAAPEAEAPLEEPLFDPAAEPEPAPLAAAEPEPAGLAQVFDRLRAFAQEANRGLFAALEGGHLAAKSDEELVLALPSALAVRRFEARSGELAAVCERFFGHPLRVRLEVQGAAPASAPRAAGPDPAAQRRRQEALNHPAVNQALEVLQGEILEIRPLGSSGDPGRA
jgi:DNA polymerase-3 subunit gamma/tau